jgi:hypothetical protein
VGGAKCQPSGGGWLGDLGEAEGKRRGTFVQVEVPVDGGEGDDVLEAF